MVAPFDSLKKNAYLGVGAIGVVEGEGGEVGLFEREPQDVVSRARSCTNKRQLWGHYKDTNTLTNA